MTIDCPVCDHNFEPETDAEGKCYCPSCGTGMMLLNSSTGGFDYTNDFSDCYLESAIIENEVKNIDDTHLEDEIAQEMAIGTYMKGTECIFQEMSSVGYMAYDTRKKAEGVYILMHSRLWFKGFKNEHH